jgi:putative glutamine amidotransferase
MTNPRIIIPLPTSFDEEYNSRSWPQYAAACQRFGAEAVPIPLKLDQSEQARILATGSGILLPGSPADVNPEKYGESPVPECARSDPFREAADELLLQDAFNLGKPLLGICYGMQSLNVWRGGTLTQHLQTQVNHRPGRDVHRAHALVILPSSRLQRLIAKDPAEPMFVNSSHHQAVARAGDGLRVTATSEADGTIEAFEGSEGFVLGVQWHPERTLNESSLSARIFQNFLEAAGHWALAPVRTSVG